MACTFGEAGDIALLDIVRTIHKKISDSTHSNEEIMTDKFKKFDNEKPDLSLIPPLLLEMYTEAASIGEKKYGRNNWKNIEAKDASRIVAAALRHLSGYKDTGFLAGEYKDQESGFSHLSHALWQLVTLEYMIRKFGIEEIRKYL